MEATIEPAATAEILAEKLGARPRLAVVLGSGFGRLREMVRSDSVAVPMSELPGFPPVRVKGHAGVVIFGNIGGADALLLAGRAHFYEGHSMAEIAFPMRVLAALGVQAVLLTNAAGAINLDFKPGDFMAVSDHLNFMGANPLAGRAATAQPRFLDLSRLYDADLLRLLRASAGGACVHEGVYLAVSGPSYETPAEIRAFRALGADAVGMSTVPEAIVAHQCGMRVAALSCLTNMAAGVTGERLTHQEVLARAEAASAHACAIISRFLAQV